MVRPAHHERTLPIHLETLRTGGFLPLLHQKFNEPVDDAGQCIPRVDCPWGAVLEFGRFSGSLSVGRLAQW